VKPWVFAAESAKIATLEAVAEKIEEGQIALEKSMRTIGEIEGMLKPAAGNGGEEEGADIWLADGGEDRRGKGRREKAKGARDVWEVLDGNLGLLRSEGEGL
jgi:hypothetical protein